LEYLNFFDNHFKYFFNFQLKSNLTKITFKTTTKSNKMLNVSQRISRIMTIVFPKHDLQHSSNLEVHSNLCKTNTLGTTKKWQLLSGGRFFGDHLCNKSSNWDLKMVVVIDRWSLFVGDRLAQG
jgi:hypothetical protein